ncbi:alpha/beta-hydrolase [Punctularia strigosozonata HHB-11173 SS5]|uniref:Alpha/beta-hydrolase n=1 Tax=Punctularia strigosozonata (strain HHB-11173) TaxID=741275 RepID=R7S0T5_PUNST|nr:alpha/beta-hydrolase [Punctularia strigosozonata HHB-11173 SS5]EIN04000.1 alpha/beta-hydrolase [Punctularia strigosozonata HHB-11173 SS5]
MTTIPRDQLSAMTTVKVPSKSPGWNLDTWVYLPTNTDSRQRPVIIMAHGLSANKTMGLAAYAREFASLGYACVVFDYRRWGSSDGTPRHVLYISEQLEDYRVVIKWCRTQSEYPLDPQRIVVWGTSLSGGHAISLACEPRLALIGSIAQCPYTGVGPKMQLSVTSIKTLALGIWDALRQAFGGRPIYINACAEPGQVGFLNQPGSSKGMQALLGTDTVFPNEISASSLFELPFYSPAAGSSGLACQTLIIPCVDDNLCAMSGAVEIAHKSKYAKLEAVPGGLLSYVLGLPDAAERR